ncbi:alpha/beta hydrolase [Leptolyngbya sp. NIES-2104]|uniref:alpha/beta hydrolase n=1 Tax=Leptolyngbya sp. NIES-2104 TaxID=1552121 RepID=UPI00073EC315|nr:alpha/beta hydrolase [Leptolyngbya sp. NIES-2104]
MRQVKGLKWMLSAIASVMSIAVLSRPAVSAERVFLSYGILERSISVSALETYARTGALDSDLYVYSQYVTPRQLQILRRALLTRADVDPIAVSQFLYTQQGEILLRRLGQVIQPESRDTGFFAIRGAVILAAADPEGLTLLNVLRKFPTRALRIDLQRSLDIAGDFGDLINRTTRATQTIADLASQENTSLPGNRPDLAARGPYGFERQTLRLVDRSRAFVQALGRERVFPVDVYLPFARRQALPSAIPVIVISHGLGSDRGTFRYLAEHLASWGFAVAVPEHPGSNARQLQALVAGTVNEVTSPSEFIDRPLDIKYLLDELQRRASSDSRYSRLNLKQVGVLGQSFGGYTAMALVGATINFQQLQQSCQPAEIDRTLNLSILLQCRAAGLPPINYNLSDPRVKAIIAINPITSSVFGQSSISQIKVPTLIMAGNADTVAPALPEQIQPFTWLQTPDRYLAVIDRGTHFSTLEEGDAEGVPVPPEVIGPAPNLARRYTNALSLAFFQTYIANRSEYRPFLSSTYARALSQNPLPLSLIQSLTVAQLNQD